MTLPLVIKLKNWITQVLIFSLLVTPVAVITIFYLRGEVARVSAIIFGIALLVNIMAATVLVHLGHILTEKHRLEDIKVRDEALFQALTNGVIMYDAQKKVLLANPAATRFTGLPQEGYYLSELYKLFPSLDLEKNVDAAIKEDKIIHIEEAPLVNFFFEIFIVSVTHHHGEIIGGAIVLHDITQMKELDRAKSEFISIAAHQLRTPPTIIRWYAEMLLGLDAGTINPKQKTYVEQISQANHRMIAMINALLNISRIEMGTFTIQPKTINLTEIAKTTLTDLAAKIREKKLSITQTFDPTLPLIQADPQLLTIIFDNLLSNAIEYTPEGGRVTFEISPDGDGPKEPSVFIRVSDTGFGIPKVQQPKIFTKLFRADNVRQRDPDGNGLGLYLVKSILDSVGGTIRFESQENKGTTFFVTLPLSGMQKKEGSKQLS